MCLNGENNFQTGFKGIYFHTVLDLCRDSKIKVKFTFFGNWNLLDKYYNYIKMGNGILTNFKWFTIYDPNFEIKTCNVVLKWLWQKKTRMNRFNCIGK